ncbi:MAG: FGGY family carbohydrate kinase [Oscillospiraceae bacterium]|nr:FGGY family carbohydrate kinase [Oscillospiraceae bacterium]
MQYLIGVDLGTQGTKATLCDETGAVVSETFEASRLIHPEPGAVEQDPEEMLSSILDTIKQIVGESGIKPGDVAGIGIDGQMAGTMGIDRDGMAATPYDSWLDTRCGKYRGHFLGYGEKVVEENVIRLTGAPVTYAHGPKILWWKYERPGVYRKIRKFLSPGSYCVMRMCGIRGDDAFIDHTYLHFTGFADIENSDWSKQLLTALDVDASKMPRIVRPYDKVGALTREMANRCGLLTGTPVVAGCGDTAASSFGAGIVRPGLLFDVAGTASVFACATGTYAPDTANKTIMYPKSVVDGLYTPMAYINGGGMCLKWFRDDVLQKSMDYPELDAMAADIKPGSAELFFLPHFSGRVCPNDTLVRGSYVNLSWHHNTAHMYRAILEGIAYEYRIYADIIRKLAPDTNFEKIITIGGGAKSHVFNQIKADVLGVPVCTINRADTAAIGCCVIAGYGMGLYDSLTEPIERLVSLRDQISPAPGLSRFYGKRADIYADIFPALHGVYGKLAEL